VDHDILEKLIKEHIEDQQFIDLYWKLVKAGYVDFKTLKESTKVVPQGGIISPILSNLYLHELDKFIEEERLMLDNKYKKTNIRNKVYDELDNRIQNITKLERKYKAQGRTLSEEVKRERVMKIKERRKVKATIPDPDTAKIYYERCADD
jgi:retron-type reverse transcriptase